jgi:uncharacterized protein (DUF1697 family)
VALLRGVNVGGKKISMPDLREVFEGLGYADVETYIQSGNVVFCDQNPSHSDAPTVIADAIQRDLGVETRVLVRSAKELAVILSSNPFLSLATEPKTLHVTFLEEQPASSDVVAPEGIGFDRYCVHGREVYLFCPEGYGRTKLHTSWWERKLQVAATTRNWATVVRLAEMAST